MKKNISGSEGELQPDERENQKDSAEQMSEEEPQKSRSTTINDLNYYRKHPWHPSDPKEHEAAGLTYPPGMSGTLDSERYSHRARLDLLIKELGKEKPRISKQLIEAEVEAIQEWLDGRRELPTMGNPAVNKVFSSLWLLMGSTIRPESSGSIPKIDDEPINPPEITPKGTDSVPASPLGKDEKAEQSRNYFRRTGEYWNIRFNGHDEIHIKHRPAFFYLLRYLKSPRVKIPSANVFRQVQAWALHCSSDNGSLSAHPSADRLSDSTTTVMESELSNDRTKTVTSKQREDFEKQAKEFIDEIERLESRGETEKADAVSGKLQKMIDVLKKEYSATLDGQTGKFTKFNRTAKGKDRASELARRNLKNAVNYIKRWEEGCARPLSLHLEEYLVKHKDIYQPPPDFPEWDISY